LHTCGDRFIILVLSFGMGARPYPLVDIWHHGLHTLTHVHCFVDSLDCWLVVGMLLTSILTWKMCCLLFLVGRLVVTSNFGQQSTLGIHSLSHWWFNLTLGLMLCIGFPPTCSHMPLGDDFIYFWNGSTTL
jgi:hypothetical protein